MRIYAGRRYRAAGGWHAAGRIVCLTTQAPCETGRPGYSVIKAAETDTAYRGQSYAQNDTPWSSGY